ncbi:2-amino-4-hydroxy-6-hydroxymethyldihydropteridine diphosphokinase [Methylophaga sp.]|uniref:2-amino-4-hydroxy-6- hydroxymethyldihydropteridine diphosphokinase n=1 Tax=Methylophaga sp. TaxID=2024840 RepID=UPI0025EC7312|nr:2-amino-4-hydroxy-6-hydroxymethyldihydropteridine diphosphokinase [Methylophaga sp.]
MKQRQGYLLGLGSNINPQQNTEKMVIALLQEFKELKLSRVLKIPPVGMNSHRDFLNTIVFVETDLSQIQLKRFCNQIEISLGRDRDDPLSKTKDRPADIDILKQLSLPEEADIPVSSITDEYFLYPIIRELLSYLTDTAEVTPPAGVLIKTSDLRFGETATTIYWDSRAGNKGVL